MAIPTQQMKIEPETHKRFKIESAQEGLTFSKFLTKLLEKYEEDKDIKSLSIPIATKEYKNNEKKSLTIQKEVYIRLRVFTAKNDFTLSVGWINF